VNWVPFRRNAGWRPNRVRHFLHCGDRSLLAVDSFVSETWAPLLEEVTELGVDG
jgi:hypothetical protein